ncbi:MAG: hypothetical protein INH41_14650 [Myxococcaceae bacterium]|jgi:hypothetical protein|nr:hypothetical protein [Myxococcaceae bacterium]
MAAEPALSATSVAPTGCCPPFDPSTLDRKEVHWEKKLFLKDHVTSFLHVPLNMNRHMQRDAALIEAAGAEPPQRLMLADERSPWSSELFIDVTRPVPGATMETLSGTFLTRVFEGPYRDAGRWADQMKAYVTSKGRTLERLFFGYVLCPACAKAYGKNYVVLFAKVDDAHGG